MDNESGRMWEVVVFLWRETKRTKTHDGLFREKLQTLDLKNMNGGYEALEDGVLRVPEGPSTL
jgi:hypothetical protein